MQQRLSAKVNKVDIGSDNDGAVKRN